MEQLAAGAAKALGSLWGGIGSVAKQVTTQASFLPGRFSGSKGRHVTFASHALLS
jgi:hypothetical protein